jgi:opacity protein-like surface antigen
MNKYLLVFTLSGLAVGMPQFAVAQDWIEEAAETGGSFDFREPPRAKLGGQVFFRAGAGFLTSGNRGGDIFADSGGANGLNDGESGIDLGFGFDLPLMEDPWFGNDVLGEVHVGYTEFSSNRVQTTTSTLLGGTSTSEMAVTAGTIAASPKYSVALSSKVRAWVVPLGMEFIIIGPPTNDSTYLDVAIPFGVGADYLLTEDVSIGVDWRYHWNQDRTNVSSADFTTVGAYVGFNF